MVQRCLLLRTKNYKISVVLLTKNSAETVKKTLESIFSQTRKPDEIVVVDGNSKDSTQDIVTQYPIKLVTEPGLGFGHARNLGIKNAEGDIIFFIDSDCYADDKWIERILPHFSDPNIAGVTGQTRLWNTNHGVARFLACVGGRMDMPTKQRFVKIAPTMNLAIRHEAVLEVGGFDESLSRGEDTELTYKVTKRHKILYEPEAVVWFKGSPTLRIASKKCVNHFIGVGQLFAKYGFNRLFVRFSLPVRGIILIAAVISLFLTLLQHIPWYVPTILFVWLLAEFLYKSAKMYMRYHDGCVIYYIVFFTFWSLASLAIFYGLFRQLRKK